MQAKFADWFHPSVGSKKLIITMETAGMANQML